MSDYSNTWGGAAKDASDATANAADLDTQFDAIATAVNSKANKAKVEATGDTSAGDNAAMGYTAVEGAILTGQGSTNDVTIKNDADAEVMGVLTGTTTADFKGAVNVAGVTTVGGDILSDTDSTDDLGATGTRWANVWTDVITVTDTITLGSDAINALTLQTSQATTSGTQKDFTGIPSWAKKLSILFVGVSVSTVSNLITVQIGDGAIVSSGYACGYARMTSSPLVAQATSSFPIYTANASEIVHGVMTLVLADTSNTWVCSANLASSDGAVDVTYTTSGSLSLTGALDRVRIATPTAFDAGAVNILVE